MSGGRWLASWILPTMPRGVQGMVQQACEQGQTHTFQSTKEKMSWKKGNDIHHLIPKSRCPHCARRPNLIVINKEKHVEWHKVFGNLTLREVIELLQRLERAKKKDDRL